MWQVLLAAVLAASPAKPQETMAKLVVRDLLAPPDSVAGKPTTLYRSGTRYGRLENAPDPWHNLHAIVIVAEPKAWELNAATKTGRVMTDPGPTFEFHAPIIPGKKGEKPPPLLEFGREKEFLKAHQAAVSRKTIDGKEYVLRDATVDGYRVALLEVPATGMPWRIKVERGGTILCAYEYLTYQLGLPFAAETFAPPAGYELTETGPEAAAK